MKSKKLDSNLAKSKMFSDYLRVLATEILVLVSSN